MHSANALCGSLHVSVTEQSGVPLRPRAPTPLSPQMSGVEEEAMRALTRAEVIDELIVLIVAASDTSNITSVWLAYRLAVDAAAAAAAGTPPLWARLYDEIKAHIGPSLSDPVSREALDKLCVQVVCALV